MYVSYRMIDVGYLVTPGLTERAYPSSYDPRALQHLYLRLDSTF